MFSFVFFLVLQEPLRLQPIRAAPSGGPTVGHSLHHCQPRLVTTYQGNMYICAHICILSPFLFIKATWGIASAAIWWTRLTWHNHNATYCPHHCQPSLATTFFQICTYNYISFTRPHPAALPGGPLPTPPPTQVAPNISIEYIYFFTHVCMNFITDFCLLRLHGTLFLQP